MIKSVAHVKDGDFFIEKHEFALLFTLETKIHLVARLKEAQRVFSYLILFGSHSFLMTSTSTIRLERKRSTSRGPSRLDLEGS